MPFNILRSDITKVKADAIVSTANPKPVIGRGTERAIYQAAGEEKLLAARRAVGPIRCGEAAWTPGFGLGARYIIHTVSPVWTDGRHGEEALLRKAYDAALGTALELNCGSVAFPLLSSGNDGFPKDIALTAAIRAFTDFLLEHEMQIELILFGGQEFSLAGSLFDGLKSYIDDRYVEEKLYEEYGFSAPAASAQAPAGSRRERKQAKETAASVPAPSALPVFAAKAASDHGNGIRPKQNTLEEYLKQHEKTFSEHLLDLLKERDGKDSEVYKRAEISRQLFSKILSNKDYQPTKSTAIQLAIGLQLDVNMTQKLLRSAGYSLTRSSRADLVVQYFIERKNYSIPYINTALYDCGLPLLKTGLKP